MSEWASQLERFVTKGQKKSVSESGNKNIDKEADICFLKLLEEEQQAELKQNSTYSKIPRFYFKKPETKTRSTWAFVKRPEQDSYTTNPQKY